MLNKNLIYNDVLFHKIRNSSSILSIDKDNHYNFEIEEKNLKIKNVTYDEVLKEVKDGNKFDFIIGKKYEFEELPEKIQNDIELQFDEYSELQPIDYYYVCKILKPKENFKTEIYHWIFLYV